MPRKRLGGIATGCGCIGDAPGKGALFSFEMKGAHAHDVATMIDRSGVAVRAGTHCAQPLLARFGVDLDLPRLASRSTTRARKWTLWSRRWSAPPISLPEWKRAMNDTHAEAEIQPNRPAFAVQDAMSPEELDRLTDGIITALKTVYDPEIPADIYELGLIYRVDIDDSRFVNIDMTLTAPGCPVAGEMPVWVRERGRRRAGRRGRQGQDGVRPAVGSEPHVGRGAGRAGYVVSCAYGVGLSIKAGKGHVHPAADSIVAHEQKIPCARELQVAAAHRNRRPRSCPGRLSAPAGRKISRD